MDGIAGMGKSDVLLQFVENLNERRTPYLAFRLDRTTPTRRPEDVGHELDLPASPTVTLAAVAQGNEAILIIDQLDAVSTTSGRSPQFLECVTDIVRSAHAVPNLRIVLVCRTFDVENDARLRQLMKLGEDQKTVTVGLLDRTQLQGPLSELGYPPNSLSDSQLELLRVPLHLALVAEVTTGTKKQLDFSTPLDLYNTFWRTKRQNLDERFGSSSWVDIIHRLVDYMSQQQVLRAPAMIVDAWEQYANAMESAHVLRRDGQQLAFFHETFFDYAFARSFIARQGSVRSLLARDQFLFRRAQVRQILAHERLSTPLEYQRDLSHIVHDPSVRFHLKDVVVSWLSQVAPTRDEWSLIEPLLMNETLPLFGRAWRTLVTPEWFKFADSYGFVKKRLQVQDKLTERMVSILGYAVKTLPARVAELLAPFEDDPRWRGRVVSIASQVDLGTNRSLFDLFMKWIGQKTTEATAQDIAEFGHAARILAESRPDWACELLGRYIKRRAALARDSGFDNPFDDEANVFSHGLHLDDFVERISSGAPIAYVEHAWPEMLEIILRASKETDSDTLLLDPVWALRHFGGPNDLEQSLLSGAEEAFQFVAQHEPERFDRLLAEHHGTKYETVLYLLYQGFSANTTRYADAAIEFVLADPKRLRVRYSNSDYWATRRLLEAVTPLASSTALTRLETVLLNFYPNLRWDHGRAQFALLGGIAPLRRSPAVQKRIAEFQRKFGEEDTSAPQGTFGGAVRSPIAAEAAHKMTDEQWLSAISKYKGSYRDRMRDHDFLKGGAEQLAHVLEAETKRDPARFARLADQLGDDANVSYFNAVLLGVAEATEQLPLVSTQALIERCHRPPKRPCGRWIARPLRKHAKSDLPPELLAIVSWYALNDPDPAADRKGSDGYRFDLFNDGLNSVRGGVASDIAHLVQANMRHLPQLEEAIRGVVADRVAAVRAVAAEVIYALVPNHLASAQSLSPQLVEGTDDRLLTTHYVRYYLLWQSNDDYVQLRPIIERMIQSTFSSVREHGAAYACLAALQREEARTLANACLTSDDESLRPGAANVYKSNLTTAEYAERCSVALGKLFNDSSAEVRKAAGNAIWRLEGTQLGDHVDLARAFLASAAFEANVNDLVHALTETTAAVPDLILETCERILDAFETNRQGPLAYQAEEAIGLVLRAYADTDERTAKDRALDLIDRSLRLDIYGTNKILAEHDRWWGKT